MPYLNRHVLVRMIMLAIRDGPMGVLVFVFRPVFVITAGAMDVFFFVLMLVPAIGSVNMFRLVLVMAVRPMDVFVLVFILVLMSMFAIGPVNVVVLVFVIMVMTAARAVFVLMVSHLLLPSGQ